MDTPHNPEVPHSHAGPLVLLMRPERSYEIRVAILEAIQHSHTRVLTALVHTGSFTQVRRSFSQLLAPSPPTHPAS